MASSACELILASKSAYSDVRGVRGKPCLLTIVFLKVGLARISISLARVYASRDKNI